MNQKPNSPNSPQSPDSRNFQPLKSQLLKPQVKKPQVRKPYGSLAEMLQKYLTPKQVASLQDDIKSKYSISKALFIHRNKMDLSVQDVKDKTKWTGEKISLFERQSNEQFDLRELKFYCKAIGMEMDHDLLGKDFIL